MIAHLPPQEVLVVMVVPGALVATVALEMEVVSAEIVVPAPEAMAQAPEDQDQKARRPIQRKCVSILCWLDMRKLI